MPRVSGGVRSIVGRSRITEIQDYYIAGKTSVDTPDHRTSRAPGSANRQPRTTRIIALVLLGACGWSAGVTAQTVVTYGYDDLNRLVSVERSDGPLADFGFDEVGNLTRQDIADSPDTDGDRIADFADLDDDNDGMPDLFEITYGFDTLDPADAMLDSDGDGRNNLTEYQLGSNPLVSDASIRRVPLPVWSLALLGLLLGAGALHRLRPERTGRVAAR